MQWNLHVENISIQRALGVSVFIISLTPLTRNDSIESSFLWSELVNLNLLHSHEGRLLEFRRIPGDDWDFNPLLSHEGRRGRVTVSQNRERISIHSPLTRGDDGFSSVVSVCDNFNPLPSHEGRHAYPCHLLTTILSISIHSPLTRGDRAARCTLVQ